jgi:hypothetical protein
MALILIPRVVCLVQVVDGFFALHSETVVVVLYSCHGLRVVLVCLVKLDNMLLLLPVLGWRYPSGFSLIEIDLISNRSSKTIITRGGVGIFVILSTTMRIIIHIWCVFQRV